MWTESCHRGSGASCVFSCAMARIAFSSGCKPVKPLFQASFLDGITATGSWKEEILSNMVRLC
jgi:hypothetical protein